MAQNKVLFILKRRGDYNPEKHSNIKMSTGLYNSASFMNDMLNQSGINSKIEVVTDNNDIDRVVYKHKPTHIIIEALWVVPIKFVQLQKLHPKVKWIIRLHSEIPFLSNEGIAFDWIGDYLSFENIIIAVNAPRILNELRDLFSLKYKWSKKEAKDKIIYLPNYYPQDLVYKKFDTNKEYVDVACFGAIRPLKNHILQALAAIKFADSINKKLRFHINFGRVEQNGENILNNLKSIFTNLSNTGHLLVKHDWEPREKFLKTCSQMDIGLQVSLSETFNIVGADLVSQGVPLVGSYEIPWLSKLFSANPTDSDQIYHKLLLTYYIPYINIKLNQYLLMKYTNKTKKRWITYFK